LGTWTGHYNLKTRVTNSTKAGEEPFQRNVETEWRIYQGFHLRITRQGGARKATNLLLYWAYVDMPTNFEIVNQTKV
jgi:hypothetical protein